MTESKKYRFGEEVPGNPEHSGQCEHRISDLVLADLTPYTPEVPELEFQTLTVERRCVRCGLAIGRATFTSNGVQRARNK